MVLNTKASLTHISILYLELSEGDIYTQTNTFTCPYLQFLLYDFSSVQLLIRVRFFVTP